MANKNNKVYYGEYSLDRWIKLVLTKKIVLPPYQRYFVWTEKQTARLLKSIEKYQYLPAVTVGACEDATSHKKINMLLDGQQRLTSVLLACLGKFPNVRKPDNRLKYVDEVEGADDDGMDDILSEWTFTKIQEMGSSKSEVIEKINSNYADKYKELVIKHKDGTILVLDETFLKTHYIPFVYIVPDANAGADEKNRYFTNVFHSINREGTKLTPQESRAALYYQGGDNRTKLEPTFCKAITVKDLPMDFVRYLALLSNYEKGGQKPYNMAKGYSVIRSREGLYEDFVYAFSEKDFSDSLFSLDLAHYGDNLAYLQNAINDLPGLKDRKCNSIIEMDYFFSGLIYHIIIKGKRYDMAKWLTVCSKLSHKYATVGDDHKKAPSQLKFLRERFKYSIDCYKYMF